MTSYRLDGKTQKSDKGNAETQRSESFAGKHRAKRREPKSTVRSDCATNLPRDTKGKSKT
jgi:hypothetical protein